MKPDVREKACKRMSTTIQRRREIERRGSKPTARHLDIRCRLEAIFQGSIGPLSATNIRSLMPEDVNHTSLLRELRSLVDEGIIGADGIGNERRWWLETETKNEAQLARGE